MILTIIKEFFGDFSKTKLFLIVFCFSLLAILLSLWIGGFWATSIVIVPAIVSILQVTKGIWTPEGGGKSKIGMASLGVALIVIGLNEKWRPFIDSLLEPLYDDFPSLKDKLPASAPSITVLVFLVIVILIVNYFARDTTAMKEHRTPLEKEFPEKDYKIRLKSFTSVLQGDLDKIDRETNWSAENFVPLDAEVEVQSGSKRLKKVTDLLTAIRSDRRSQVFLILGDPGSGKSVALRKLCRDLLEEVDATGKVPLYVNLREWEPVEAWTEEEPPTVEELYNFVLNNIKARGDVFTDDFLKKYFKKMFEDGRLFLVLDSFDEIPAVLDVSENSWLIDKLSDVIHRFLAGGHESRGVLASRIFRRPTDKFAAKTILEIRPFTELKIVATLKKSLFYDEALVKHLFTERQELIPIARNPFTAALISSYAKDHDNTLPYTQAQLYSSYIFQRLEACKEKIQQKNLTNEKLIACAIDIADLMFTTETLGLEASIKDLKARLPAYPVEDVINILKYARLGRLGAGDEQRFSFVHRRFNEYFVVQRLRERPEKVPRDSIPTDSRWRDALVLYCEVAEESIATQIAEYCWSEIKQVSDRDLDMSDPQYLRSVHCLRFLKEAFRKRLNCIDSFRSGLATFINHQITNHSNLLSPKLAVEAVGLLKTQDIESSLTKALNIDNHWIDETALRSCSYLSHLSKDLSIKLMLSIENINPFTFFKRRKELLFSLKLSNVFSHLRKFCLWRLVDFYAVNLGFLLSCMVSPKLIPAVFVLFILYRYVNVDLATATEWTKVKLPLNRLLVAIFSLVFPMGLILLYIQPSIKPDLPTPHDYSSGMFYDYSSGMFSVVFFVLFFPWYQIYFYSPSLLRFIRQKGKKSLLSPGWTLLGPLLMVLLGIFVMPKLNERVMNTIGSILGTIAGSLGIILFSVFITSTVRDIQKLSKYKHYTRITRALISEQFYSFETKMGRLYYTRSLWNERIKPEGTWPKGGLPNCENDEASTLLAQLEEKWLGLDR